MAETSTDVIRRYLEDAIAAEKSFETQLSGFANEGDDEEVKLLFQAHAAETRTQYERLADRLQQLGGTASTGKSILAHLFNLSPRSAQTGHDPEERTVQNLMMAFTAESSECVMYEGLAAAAEAAGDTSTETLVREIQAQVRQAADRIWHLIPSRAKIAFNMLTVSEVDPSVETRAQTNRVV